MNINSVLTAMLVFLILLFVAKNFLNKRCKHNEYMLMRHDNDMNCVVNKMEMEINEYIKNISTI